uniref:Uncharacterized protein n=1 Tax=Anopheles atroparvus TaxID=41427 RepID=A0AAG5DD48_ANOAO
MCVSACSWRQEGVTFLTRVEFVSKENRGALKKCSIPYHLVWFFFLFHPIKFVRNLCEHKAHAEMRVFVLAIATLVILHGYVESKNVTTPATEKSTTRAVYRGRRTTTNPTVAATSSTTAATTTKTTAGTKAPSGTTTTKQAGSDREARGKRTLEYGNYGNYNFIPNVPAHTAQRRVSHAYQDPGQYNHFQGNYIQPQYAYQTHHPSSGGAYQGFDADSSNSIGSFQSLPPVIHPHYIEPPEPIIEIIIKESNESLPLDAQTILPKQKKKKEEVQVFYVKYHKDETNGQLVLDDPLPAIKPIPDESEEEEDLSQEPIVVTAAPPLKTTTLRAVINPDSEKYHSNSGIRISFGVEDRHQGGHQISESESESVAQPIVALPQHVLDQQRAKSDVFYQQHQHFVQQQHDRSIRQQFQQSPQPQQPQQQLPPPPPSQHHQQFQQLQQFHQGHHHQQQPQQYRVQPPPPPPPHPQQYQQHQQQHFQPQHQQQHFQPQPQQQPQPQPQRVVYNQPPPQPQQQFQYRGQYQQQPPQQQFFQQQAPVQQRPQQVRFPPPQQQQPPQQQTFYQPQPQPQVAPQQPPPPPQFQRLQEYQQPKPIPIPLHNINQQPPLRQQYTPQQQQQQQQQSPQPQPQQPQPQFNQPFNNFYKPQPQPTPQQQPTQQQQYRKPSVPPPSSQQQPPFLSHRPSQAPQSSSFQNERPNASLRGSFFDASRPVQGGLVQQAAPNLGPTRAPEQLRPTSILSDKEHLANLKHVLPAGGELVPSVSKYEKHITETIVGGSQQRQQQQQQRQQQQQQQQQRVTASPSNSRQPIYNILPSQELISHSVEPTIENVPQNIGPLASNIGPLPTPQKYVSQQAAQVIPNSQPLNFGVNPRFNANAFNEQGAASSTPSTIGTTRTTYSPTFSTTPRTTAAQRYTATPTPTTRQPTPSTTPTPTTRSAQEEAEANAKKQKALFDLPDEVPEDLRAQLLSSGILENADISVLDYDKLGETALENLPPEHLANFFNAGGGSQLAGSSNVLAVVKPNGDKLADKFITQNHDVKGKRNDRDRYEIVKQGDSAKQTEEQDDQPTIVTMPERQNVDLKVVRFDSSNQKNVTDRYIKQDSTILPSVDVTSEQEQDQSADPVFNRYLPLKINGAQFPIPDVAELRGRRIASVVVLAPVDGGSPQLGKSGESGSEEGAGSGSFLINAEDDGNAEEQQQSRFERDVLLDSQRIKFIAGEALKQLIKKPSRENFRRWLDREGKTEVDLQSVVLLVTRNDDNEQEIFMYDIATKGVTHLSGELSAAFVQVAEDNAKTQNFDEVSSIVDTGIVEQMETKASQESSPDYGTSGYALTSSEEQDEQQAQASERKATYVYPENYRGLEVNSGYSNIKK